MKRECLTCSACCYSLPIDSPDFKKPGHSRCCHQGTGGVGCTVYESRPAACREFECAWLKGLMPAELSPLATGAVIELFEGTRVACATVHDDRLWSQSIVAIVDWLRKEHGVVLLHKTGRYDSAFIVDSDSVSEEEAKTAILDLLKYGERKGFIKVVQNAHE